MFLNILSVLIRIISNSALNTGQKKLSCSTNSSETNFNTYFLLTPFCLILFITFYGRFLLSQEIMLYAFIGGLFGALGNFCLIGALKRGELSILGPINSYKSLVSLAFAYFILKETLSLASFFGIILIIFGSYFIFDGTKEGFNFKIFTRKDIQLRLLALVFTAFEAVLIKKVIVLTDAVCSFYLWVIFGCFYSFIILKISDKISDKNSPKIKAPLTKFIPLSLLVLIMQGSTNFVFSRMPVGPALALFQMSGILNVFLGYKIFKEKNPLKKFIGSIIMVIGSSIIILKS